MTTHTDRWKREAARLANHLALADALAQALVHQHSQKRQCPVCCRVTFGVKLEHDAGCKLDEYLKARD